MRHARFVAIGAVELFWVATAWPNGASAIVFVAIVVLLLSPKGDLAYGGAIAFALGTAGGVVCAAIIKFAVLPALQTFPAFCAAIGLFLVPVGFAMAAEPAACSDRRVHRHGVQLHASPRAHEPDELRHGAILQFRAGDRCRVRRRAAGISPVAAAVAGAAERVACSPSPCATCAASRSLRVLPTSEDWESRMYGRLAALPDQAEPLQRAQLLAALSVGTEIIHLRQMAPRLGATAELDAALEAFAQGNSAIAIARLRQLDRRLASTPDTGPEAAIALRARGRILVISEALAEHGPYFDAGAPA